MSTPFGHKREMKPMPGFVKSALVKAKLMDAYRARPDYQQNEYLGAIDRAIGTDAKKQKLAQMLEELGKGNLYMGAAWQPPAPVAQAKKQD